eukprot:7232326-Prymnesium_polylepis.2
MRTARPVRSSSTRIEDTFRAPSPLNSVAFPRMLTAATDLLKRRASAAMARSSAESAASE